MIKNILKRAPYFVKCALLIVARSLGTIFHSAVFDHFGCRTNVLGINQDKKYKQISLQIY